MDYSKFYTPPPIANLLVKQLDIVAPESVIDICCGSCNLLYAAKKRWPKTKLIGVDIADHTLTDVDFIKKDGREYASICENKYSLVLANPPFDSVKDNGKFANLYTNLPPEYSTSRLEVEMLLANLRLLKDNGTLVIILPSSFVNAEKGKKIRKYLANKYYIQKIIKLPEETFGASKINSYALIIKNKNITRKYTRKAVVYIKDSKYIVSKSTIIPQVEVKLGDWDNIVPSNVEKRNLQIRRGNISSQFFKPTGIPILHTAKSSCAWKPSIRYVSQLNDHAVYADKNDIIVSRIGKSAGHWCKYEGDRILISDCLYCIKDPTGEIADVLKGNTYSYPLKGVATRYITVSDFIAWYESLVRG